MRRLSKRRGLQPDAWTGARITGPRRGLGPAMRKVSWLPAVDAGQGAVSTPVRSLSPQAYGESGRRRPRCACAEIASRLGVMRSPSDGDESQQLEESSDFAIGHFRIDHSGYPPGG